MPNQSRHMLNMAGSYNKLPRECASYVADSSERKHFGEAQRTLVVDELANMVGCVFHEPILANSHYRTGIYCGFTLPTVEIFPLG